MAQRPGWQTVAREARAGSEFASFAMAAGPLLAVSRRGDGHAVLVLPGLGGNDASTAPLRWFIGRLGYRSYGWGLGTNRGFGRQVTDGLDELLAAKHEHGPVRSVVTLGSPLLGRRHPPPDTVVVADRLAQEPETWQPFQPPRWTRPWLPTA